MAESSDDIHKLLRARTQQCVTKCALLVLNHTNDEIMQRRYLTSLKEVLHSSVEEGIRLGLMKEGLTQTRHDFQSDVNLDVSRFEEKYRQNYELLVEGRDLEKEVKSDEVVKNFNKHILDVAKDQNGESSTETEGFEEGEDLVQTQAELNLIDPFSKKLMVEPVRHKPCGHVFDLRSLKSLKKKVVRCPQMGCSYRQPIQLKNLEEALDYKRELERRKHFQ
ncbi:E3 SUMO-protein ligase NSE2-like [Oratosquilla oratoria]|uniref:E3 SUMO-protein ligase NSE2-like n=1 Tax=Oratosquilla oratoria TaxID=337810 RepID=UPI003F776FBD